MYSYVHHVNSPPYILNKFRTWWEQALFKSREEALAAADKEAAAAEAQRYVREWVAEGGAEGGKGAAGGGC